MAITVANKFPAPHVPGQRRYQIADITLDTSYPTGGYTIAASVFGFAVEIDQVHPAVAVDSGGHFINVAWNESTGKLMAFYPTGGAAAPSTVTAPVVAAPTASGANAVVPSGATGVTSTAVQPTLTITQPTISAPALTGGPGIEVANTTDLSGFKVRVRAEGI